MACVPTLEIYQSWDPDTLRGGVGKPEGSKSTFFRFALTILPAYRFWIFFRDSITIDLYFLLVQSSRRTNSIEAIPEPTKLGPFQKKCPNFVASGIASIEFVHRELCTSKKYRSIVIELWKKIQNRYAGRIVRANRKKVDFEPLGFPTPPWGHQGLNSGIFLI